MSRESGLHVQIISPQAALPEPPPCRGRTGDSAVWIARLVGPVGGRSWRVPCNGQGGQPRGGRNGNPPAMRSRTSCTLWHAAPGDGQRTAEEATCTMVLAKHLGLCGRSSSPRRRPSVSTSTACPCSSAEEAASAALCCGSLSFEAVPPRKPPRRAADGEGGTATCFWRRRFYVVEGWDGERGWC